MFAFVLLLAAVFPVTVHYLGEPDPGATAGAWLAAFALLAAFHAVALGAAATTVDTTAAFVAGACALFALVMAGTEGVARHLDDWLPAWSVDAVTSLGPRRWIEELSNGRVGAGSLAYFGLMPVLALAITRGLVAARRVAAPMRAVVLRGAGGFRRACRRSRCGHHPRGAMGRIHRHQRRARAHPRAGDSRHPRIVAGEVTATLFWSAEQDGVPRPSAPTHAVPGRCSMLSRVQAAGSSPWTGEIRAPTPRRRLPP